MAWKPFETPQIRVSSLWRRANRRRLGRRRDGAARLLPIVLLTSLLGSPPLSLVSVFAILAAGSAPASARADDASPPRFRWLSTGPKAPQRSVDGVVLDRAPVPLRPPVARVEGFRVLRTGPKQPVVVGHLGCPGCLDGLDAAGLGVVLELHPRVRPPLRRR